MEVLQLGPPVPSPYGRSIVGGAWSEDSREWVVSESRFQEIPDDLDMLHGFMGEMLPITIATWEEH